MPGVIAAGNSQTAAAGAAILDQGGNAVDAAIAAAFTSFIAEVGVVHLGGSGFAQVFDPASGQHLVYDFFSNMPGAGSQVQNDRLDFQRVTIDYGSTTQDFHLGRGSVAVPGNIFGLCRLAADFGSLPLKALLGPAQKLADEGAVLDQFQADTCALLKPLYTNTPGMRAIFAPDGDMVQSGDIVRIPYLGDTLRLLIQVGEQYAREGALAQAILADQRQHGGLLTAKDLQAYQVRRQEPIRLPYRGYEILLPPPASTGGALTAFALKLLASFPINEVEHGSSAHLRLLAEVLAATGRARPFWDRAVVEESWQSAVDALMADDFIRPFVQDIRSSLETGRPSPVAQEAQGPASTSHLSVIDDKGMAVALTTTAGESAGYVVPGTGFIPNNILGEEDLNPGGFHRWLPGQRIFTMMTPTIVLHKDKIRLVTGSGGANRIRSAILQVLVNVLDFDMPLVAAVNAPRVHLENGVLHCELGYDARAADQLEEMGYVLHRWATRSIYFGGAHSVAQREDGRLVAAGDNRRGGAVAYRD